MRDNEEQLRGFLPQRKNHLCICRFTVLVHLAVRYIASEFDTTTQLARRRLDLVQIRGTQGFHEIVTTDEHQLQTVVINLLNDFEQIPYFFLLCLFRNTK